ncbi:GNAT family N-acetyltransferase [Costertonia aggregata]|uniref:N-acetyltransferase domain-containing protein n=1 Tax=Costertonia aggregata TaxID=343403 RepID=A0A7H9AU46_9FLAO|nr:GNAT family N-acetyltransferase [Costertonia aggregata]QLG46970.1 hypothetical protein HYG79_16950 [Costertonia aggregata]
MEVEKDDKFYRFKWFWNILRHGLFMHGLRNRLARIGIDIMPYYWVLEEATPLSNPPKLRGKDISGFRVMNFDEKDVIKIKNSIIGIEQKDLLQYIREGQICIGIKHNDEIAAYTFIKPDSFYFRDREFKFKANEVYLHSMYTFEKFRGKNMAPYLRYECYEMLKNENIDYKYSVSEYFNKSTIRFKKKLNSEHKKLYLSIILFGKITWNFTLKTFRG